MLFIVCVSAFVSFVCVMGVVVGVCGWCCFQYCVAVVCASRRVPGVVVCVSWLVSGVCLGVGWLVCVVWFRMLTCLASFFFLVLFLLVCLVNNGLSWVWAGFGVGWWLARVFLSCSGVFLFVW